MHSSRVLVTGGGGFIGTHLVRRLLASGMRVRLFGRFEHGLSTGLEVFANDIEIVAGDIRDEHALLRAADSVDSVFHLAGVGTPNSPQGLCEAIISTNVLGTQNVLAAAVQAGARRFVLSSSASVYGDLPYSRKAENQPLDPQSAYAASKVAAEKSCYDYHMRYGLETVPLRFFNVYGPGQDRHGTSTMVVPSIVRALKSGADVVLYGDGEQTRDFVYIDDVLEGAVAALQAPYLDGQPVNIGSGRPTSILELIHVLSEAMGIVPRLCMREKRPGEVRSSIADISRARLMFGFEPKVTLAEGARFLAHSVSEVIELTS
jgi:UDP-glucose 4-epimerase